MSVDPQNLRFFADESVLGLGKTLAIARRDLVHPGHPIIPEVPTGALDTIWIPQVAARDLVVIARDRRIRTKPAELEALKNAGLRVFWIAGKKDLTTWGYLTRLVRRWDEIEEMLATRGPGPWFVAVNEASLKEIPLP